MSLIKIEYGSIASSETMNKNFNYLENKISETSDNILTSISSIVSNIATINSRLSEISELINNNNFDLNTKLDEYKSKTKILVQEATSIPHWNAIRSIAINDKYTALSNGFLIFNSKENNGVITINTSDIECTELIVLPIKKGDVISTTISSYKAYFLPVTEISIENF